MENVYISHLEYYGEETPNKMSYVEEFWRNKPQYKQSYDVLKVEFAKYKINFCISMLPVFDKITLNIIELDDILYLKDIIIPAEWYHKLLFIERDISEFLTQIYSAKLKFVLSDDIKFNSSLVGVITHYDNWYKKQSKEELFYTVGYIDYLPNTIIIMYGNRFFTGTVIDGIWNEYSVPENNIIFVQKFIYNFCDKNNTNKLKLDTFIQ